MLIRVRSESIAGPRIGTWQKFENVSDDLSDPSPLSDSRDSFLAREPLPILYLVNHILVRSYDVIFMQYWITDCDNNVPGL